MNTESRLPTGLVFVPYHASIKKVFMYLQYYQTQPENRPHAKFDLYVITNLGVIYSVKNKLFYDKSNRVVYIENWGEINMYSFDWKNDFPVQEYTEMWIEPRLDVASMSNNIYKLDCVLTDRWFPSYNGCYLRLNDVDTISYFDVKEDYTGWPATHGYKFFSLHKIIKNNLSNQGDIEIEQDFIDELEFCRLNGLRAGFTLGVTSVPTTGGNHDGNIYYNYPSWMYNKYKNNYYIYAKKPYYLINVTSGGNTVNLNFLNWDNPTVRQDFMDCMEAIHDYMVSNPTNSTKKYEAYVDFIKVAFAGTWGEGLSLDMPADIRPADDEVLANELIAISDSVFNVCGDREHVFPLGTTMNEEIPQTYRDYLFNSQAGFFFDGVGNMSRYYFIEGNKTINNGVGNQRLSASSERLMNKAFVHSKTHFVSLECVNTLSTTQKPDFADIEAAAYYLNPDVMNLNNIFYHNVIKQSPPLYVLQSIKRLSRFVGTRPYIILNNISFSGTTSAAILNVSANIGNYGTAFIREFWRLRFYIKDLTDNTLNSTPFESGVDLRGDIPKPFEVGVPNFYDTVHYDLVIPLTNLTLTNGSKYHVMIALEDVDGIYQKNLLFCNTEESLPREQNNGTLTGRFYLYQNLKFTSS